MSNPDQNNRNESKQERTDGTSDDMRSRVSPELDAPTTVDDEPVQPVSG